MKSDAVDGQRVEVIRKGRVGCVREGDWLHSTLNLSLEQPGEPRTSTSYVSPLPPPEQFNPHTKTTLSPSLGGSWGAIKWEAG
jgi:hypothetical protein